MPLCKVSKYLEKFLQEVYTVLERLDVHMTASWMERIATTQPMFTNMNVFGELVEFVVVTNARENFVNNAPN